jgi:cytochrome b
MKRDTLPTQASKTIQVWDLPTRLFHWSLVILIAISWTSAEVGGNAMQYHLWAGYAALGLVGFRVLWGLAGSDTARFASFVKGVGPVRHYLGKLRRGATAATVGHNPLGGWMIVIMLTALAIQVGTGLFANDDIATEGPLYHLVSKDLSDTLTEIHGFAFDVLLALIGLHVAAVLFYRFVKRENLVTPMLTGRKQVDDHVPAPKMAGHGRALVAAALAAGVAYFIVMKL